MVPPGFLALNTRITVRVLAETATVNIAPNVICLRVQVALLGWAMKGKQQRKCRRREMSRTYLRPQLLALTMGMSQCFTKPHKTTAVMTQNYRVMQASDIPKESLKAKKVTVLGRQ